MLKNHHNNASQSQNDDSKYDFTFMKAADETLMLDDAPISTDLLFRIKIHKNETYKDKAAVAGVCRFDPNTRDFVAMPNDYGYSLLAGLEPVTAGEAKNIKKSLIALATKYGDDILPPPPKPNSHGQKKLKL